MKFNTKALTISTTIVIWLVTVMTIWSELSSPFKEFLAGVTGHHWVTKGVFALILFVIAYNILAHVVEDKQDSTKSIYCVVASIFLGGFIIFGFYVWHFLA